jgi:REP element-mobilizing transposase RayT
MSKTASQSNVLYFVTLTIADWISVFIRRKYFEFIIENLQYCQKKKGLEIFEYVIMPNHIHMICLGLDNPLSNILRDFKSYTSKELYNMINNNSGESRRKWMISGFNKHGKKNNLNKDFQIWQNNNWPTPLTSNFLIEQKAKYIKDNPVKAGFVSKPENYVHSSAHPDNPLQLMEF